VIQRYKTVPRVVKRGGRFGGDLTKWGSPLNPPKGWRFKEIHACSPPLGRVGGGCSLTIVKSVFVRIIQKSFLDSPQWVEVQKRYMLVLSPLRGGVSKIQMRSFIVIF